MPKNLGLYNNDLSVPRKKDIDDLTDAVDGKVSKSGDTMTGTLTVGSASLQTNGYVKGTWFQTTANVALSSTPSQIAVLSGGLVYSRTPSQIKGDIGLGNVDNVKQYSESNPPPYPVTSVNGQTGAVTIEADIPEGLVKYEPIINVESVDTINADTLQGHNSGYFATKTEADQLSTNITTLQTDVNSIKNDVITLQSGLDITQQDVVTLGQKKLSTSGGTMTGALIAQGNTNYSTAQVRNIIISTEEPSGGGNGDIWIRYQA